ncbi:AraD1 family protein [Rhizobacter sp. Root1221]|uniref:AraD1 family protein n=1 Tax=Rhizobacter sp. Root1221 TaxID=1736433 RepID=UPI0006F69F64|nr:AraD1 family protein [Rhizobacter sp. Root1221]KQV98523.1 FAH family protein [Rhizobacter sp. Root1221]
MRLIQFLDDDGTPNVGQVDDAGLGVRRLAGHRSTYEVARTALARRTTLDAVAEPTGDTIPYARLLADGRVLPPLTHPDPAHCLVTGTGLTHLGSAATRDAMHQKLSGDDNALSDSMRMFKWGVDGGRPTGGQPGAQPEWFFKGDGQIVAAPGAALVMPDFALDGGEEPELVGLYLIGDDGTPHRLGFAIGNEFSDHVTERQNYLYLAHSKLRACAVGPELRTGALPDHLAGTSRVRRGDNVVWEKPFLTGDANMCHSIANLEYHHFKYAAHRRPGDVHLHFFGTSTLSFADGIKVEPGDRFEIDLPDLGAPLVNPLAVAAAGFAIGGVQPL